MFPWGRSPYYDDRVTLWRDPFDEMRQIARQMDSLVTAMGPAYWGGPRARMDVDTANASVVNDDKKFEVTLDVKQFKPEELEVKTSNNALVIHGKHEEHKDEHGFIKREFTRSFYLPKGVAPESFKSNISPEGVLTISAPKMAIDKPGEHRIAIEQAKK
ncbi:small heat shock protein [Trichuris trichiura]|uniref:Small heat shock protein n=1 Tax=Trichuris trichiura TaxID=36087 RepID=A0A077Z7R3_TRITR|nr:small heat shock protein [Trichuris trichiura]